MPKCYTYQGCFLEEARNVWLTLRWLQKEDAEKNLVPFPLYLGNTETGRLDQIQGPGGLAFLVKHC